MRIINLLTALVLLLPIDFLAQCPDNIITGHAAHGEISMNSYGVSTDDNGNIFTMGNIDSTFGYFNGQLIENTVLDDGSIIFVAKLDSSGATEWIDNIEIKEIQNQHRLTSYGFDTYMVTTVQDSFHLDGQTYYNEDPGILIVKYNSDGTVQWTKNYETTPFQQSTSVRLWTNGLTTDNEGNLIVTGFFQGQLTVENNVFQSGVSGFHREAFVLKFDDQGDLIWAIQSEGNFNQTSIYNRGWSITCDSNSDIIIGGLFLDKMTLSPITVTESSTSFTPYVAKLDGANGDCLWIKGAEFSTPSRFGNFYGVATDSEDNIIAAGLADANFTLDGVTVETDNSNVIILAKFNKNGNLRFVKNFGDNVAQGGKWGAFVETGSNDEIYFGGTSRANTDFDGMSMTRNGVFITTLDSLGIVTDLKQLGSSGVGFNSTFNATCDNFGNMVVAGNYGSTDTLYDSNNNLLVPEEESGVFLWKTCLDKELISSVESVSPLSYLKIAPNPTEGNFFDQ